MTGAVPSVFIFIALSCEAKPLIRKYALKKLPSPHPFAIYGNEGMALIISGIGKIAMAGAVAYSMATFKPSNPVLVNLGIAGHKDIASGSLLLADKIFAADNHEKAFYPQLIGRFPWRTLPLCTLAQPDFKYAGDFLFDMEGAGFYEMAVKFSSSELSHCLKIISDNQYESAGNINAQQVSAWVEQQTDAVDTIIRQLEGLRQRLVEQHSELYQKLIERYHFSVSSRIKLKGLLNRWNVITRNTPLVIDEGVTDAKQLLRWLEAELDSQHYYL